MAESLTLLGLLGTTSLAEAAEQWPRDPFLPGLGLSAGIDEASDYEPLLNYLNTVLSFAAVRPGSAADRVGLTADVVIEPHPNPQPLVLRQLPDIAFVLQPNTPDAPARLFVTQSDNGVEVVVEGLPVELQLPNGLLTPLRSEADELLGPSLTDVLQAGPFEAGTYDTFAVVLRELTSSSLFVHVRVRLTEENEVVVEPAVPISIGPCRFSGLPCDGVHDLGFLPYPSLSGSHTEHELALEWARHSISTGLGTEGNGLITVRTLDLNHARDPIKQLVERFRDVSARADLEFVLEDLALPVSSWLTPVATHGRFGLRRKVLTGGDEPEAYDLSQAPIVVDLSAVVDWRLRIFRLLFESPDTVVARMAVLFGDSVAEDQALEIDVTDGWLLQGAWVPPQPIHAFTLANVRVSLMTVRIGILLRDIQEAQGAEGWLDHMRGLFDLGIKVGDGKDETVQAEIPAKPPPPPPPQPPGADLGQDLVLRNIGWDLGEPAIFPSLWFPETVKLKAFEVVQLEVEEIAFVSEDNGGRYLAFSGGISIFPGVGQSNRKTAEPGTPGVPAENQPSGGGLRFRRLRLRIGGNELAPKWLLDGISIFIKVDDFELSGSGSITDVTRDGHRYREFALGLLLRFSAMGKDFSIGAQLVYGRVTGPVDRFTYWLFGLQLSYLPLTSFDLRGIRVLVAGGMSPDLPEPSGRPQEMRLLTWYQQNSASGAVTVRSDRSQQRAGWKVEQGAEAAGVGADLSLAIATKAAILRSFIFFHRSDSGSGLLVAAEVFLLKASKPIGVGAIEVDLERDKWSALIGVDIELAKLLDTDSPLAKGLLRLTGTIFAGNQPGMFAIGQLADQASWLTFSMNKSLLGFQARVSVAFCLQISAAPGPRGVGLAVTAAAQASMGIGKVQFSASLGFIAGVWANEASSSGFIAWAMVALRIKVFWVFSFGATVKATFEQLGPQEPNYRRVSLEVRIETPWWLPDVTFRVIRVRESPQPETMPVVSSPLLTAGALEPGAAIETPIPATELGAGAVHPIAELRTLPSGPIPESVWNGLDPVSVDSTVALNFAVAIGNETTVVPSTPPGAGRQAATPPAQNQLSSTYALTQVGIRRRARFGPDAGVWTDLLAPADTEVGGLDDLMNDPDLSVTFSSALRFRWDADVVNNNAIDPRRLLVNAETPYTFLTGNPATEEGLLAEDPSFPCCSGKRTTRTHVLDFAGVSLGVRAPASQRFSESTSTLRWLLPLPPVVAAAVGPPAGDHVARVLVASATDLAVGVVTFDEPAYVIDISVFWSAPHVPDLGSALVVEAARGLEVVDRQVFPLAAPSPAVPIRCQDARGLTSVTLRYVRQAGGTGTTQPSLEAIEVRNMRYRTVREERDRVADQARCGAQGAVAGGGKLAWLPNHDYELALTVRTTVDYQGSAQEAVVVQRAGFRTRGLPGLNAVATPGTELEPYVESVYPGVTNFLYRREPVVLAFDNRFSTLLPVDRTPAPGDPAERTQVLEWVLVVQHADGRRVSVPTADWVVTHRGTAPPPRPWVPRVVDAALVRADVRRAPTIDALAQRLETLELLSPSCGLTDVRLHASQVLTHAPADPAAPDTEVSLWPARATLRAAVRRKGAPHVSRRPFDEGDETALTVADEGRITSTGWNVVEGEIAVSGAPAPGLRHYAVLGETDWDHVDIHAEIDPANGAAGIAVAVNGLPRVDRALLALVDGAGGSLRLLARRGGTTQELASTPLPAGSAAPFALEVLAFDDRVRARVGETSVEAKRDDLRDGRVAVVLDGPGRCSALHVDGLDAYLTQLTTSRFAGFNEHIASWDGLIRPLPADDAAVPGLRAATAAEIPTVMTAQADPQLRQRLFDRWVSELAIPLSPTVEGLRLGTVAGAGNTQLLVLETPEPLPFSRDVRLSVTHRVTSIPDPPPGIPRPLLRLAAGLVFERDTVHGPVPTGATTLARQARTLVHAVRASHVLNRLAYRMYRVRVETTAEGQVLEGELVEVRQTPPAPPGFPPRPLRIPLNHIVLLDRDGRPVTPPLPLPFEHDEAVDLQPLTNSVEDRALLIPSTPLATDNYTFTWTLDRQRYRTPVVDDTTHYQASVTTVIPILSTVG